MKPLGTVLPFDPTRGRTEWGERACKTIREILGTSYDAWLEKEFKTPTYQDLEWANFVIDCVRKHHDLAEMRAKGGRR